MKKRWMQVVCICSLIGAAGIYSHYAESKNETVAEDNTQSTEEIHSWQQDTTPLILTWFVAEPDYQKEWNPQTNLGDAKILEETGIQIDIDSGELSDLDALIATDALPDLITLDASAAQRLLLENSGMVLALEPLFDTYAPDENIPDSMKDWYRNEDGSWYSIASYYYGPERVNDSFGGYVGTHNNNYVRTDLLAQTGVSIDELQTKEGLLTALKKADNLTYRGRDVIPFAGWWTQNFAEQFGMNWEDEDGNLLCMYEQPEWLESLLFGNQLYREGLLTDEDFTESLNQRRRQIESGEVFFANGYSNVKDAKDVLYSNDSTAKIENAKFVYGDAGEAPQLKSTSTGGWTVTLVSSKTKHADRIAQFIAYMTQEELTLDAAPGIGTGTYTIDDGVFHIKEPVKAEFQENYSLAAAKYYMNLEFFVDWTIVQKYQDVKDDVDYQMFHNHEFSIYDSKAYDAAVTIGSGSGMGRLQGQIEEYYKSAEVRILTAESEQECKERYEETIKQMKKLGLDMLVSYENDQYQKEKRKLAGD